MNHDGYNGSPPRRSALGYPGDTARRLASSDDSLYAVESNGTPKKAKDIRGKLATSMIAFFSGVGLVTILNVIYGAAVSGGVIDSIHQNDKPPSFPDGSSEPGKESTLVSSGFRDFITTKKQHSDE